MNTPRTLVTVATYNEIENLPDLVEQIERFAPHADLLVIDDNSPDRTGRWADDRARSDPRVRCLHRPGKLGLGTATIAAMRYAIARGYDYLLNLDADFSHPPRYLPDLLSGMDRTLNGRPIDVMIGSRYVPGGGVSGWPFRRRLTSRVLNFFARWLLGLPIADCSGSFRCYRIETLRRIDLDGIRSRGYSYLEEILWRLKQAGATFSETPIIFVDRTRGHSKINWREGVAAMWLILRLGARTWWEL